MDEITYCCYCIHNMPLKEKYYVKIEIKKVSVSII